MTQEKDKVSEAPKVAENNQLASVDRLELLSSPQPPRSDAGGRDSLPPLTIDGTDSGQKPEKKSEPFELISTSKDMDPSKPTAVFLDQFARKDVDLGGTKVAHGEISRAAAEENGFNTVALNLQAPESLGNGTDYSKAINKIADMAQDGKLALGKGDVLNISMGNLDPTFEEASKFLGFPVTAQNLASQRENILKRMQEISQDESRSKEDRETAERVVNTNNAIDRLQDKGVEVVHSAGNDGQDRFSWDFMNAKWQLSSNRPSGKPDEFSASHSLTTSADGVLPLKIKQEGDLISPVPMAEQKGKVAIADTGVEFPIDSKSPFSGNSRIFNRENINPKFSQPMATPQEKAVPEQLFIPELTFSSQEKLPWTDKSSAELLSFTGKSELPKRMEMAYPMSDVIKKITSNPGPGEELMSGVINGTSFSNIGFLKDQRARLEALKQN